MAFEAKKEEEEKIDSGWEEGEVEEHKNDQPLIVTNSQLINMKLDRILEIIESREEDN